MSKIETLRTMGAIFSLEKFRDAYLNLYKNEKEKGKTFQAILFQNLLENPEKFSQDLQEILDNSTDLPLETFADVFFRKFENASPWTGHNSMFEIPGVCASLVFGRNFPIPEETCPNTAYTDGYSECERCWLRPYFDVDTDKDD